uniref:ORF3 n=1 Tax=Peanut yellow spot virus TaxID=63443 RepID=O55843_9VIRU|nr:ORF3 [Peanut yellow spot virus]
MVKTLIGLFNFLEISCANSRWTATRFLHMISFIFSLSVSTIAFRLADAGLTREGISSKSRQVERAPAK